MKILVIDDNKKNIESAKATLIGHELTTASTVQEAFDLLDGRQQFDALLTDLFMPLGDFDGAMDTDGYPKPSNDLPAGLVFAIKAVNRGIPAVICTDANHHNDWMCSLLDLLHGDKDTKKIAYVEARAVSMKAFWDESTGQIIEDAKWYAHPENTFLKDWKAVMDRSKLFVGK